MKIADILASEGTTKAKPTNTPHIHMAHPTPYWLANYPTTTHNEAIRNLRTFITKEHGTRETTSSKKEIPISRQMVIKYPNQPETLQPLMAQGKGAKYPNHPNIKIHICPIHGQP
jgi:hypothetical protein